MVRGGWVELRHLVAPLMSGQDAPGRICGQAIAQNHQGPQGSRVLRALALLPHEAPSSLRQQYLRFDQSASIIAPGREGSQSPAPPPKLVSTQTANGGGEGQPLAA